MTDEHNGAPPQPQGSSLESLDDGWSDEPEAPTPQPEAATPQPEAATPQPEAATPQPEAATPQPEAATPQPEAASPAPKPAQVVATEPEPTSAPTQPPTAAPLAELRLFGRTDVGQIREHNEDNFVVADLTTKTRALHEAGQVATVGPHGLLLGVCDGMGGAAAGEVASQLAVDIIFEKMSAGSPPTSRADLARRLNAAVEAAGARIYTEANADRARRGMGTTATISTLIDDQLFLAEVGDSRGYILRGQKLVQVTRDQSLVNQLIEAGQLTEAEAETFEHNNIILQALGTAETVQVDITYVDLRRGDKLLLCSDGLSGMVRFDEIREVLLKVDDLEEICKHLIDKANQAGGHDNITVVVANFDGDWLRPVSPDDEELKYRKYTFPDAGLPQATEDVTPLGDTARDFGVPVGWQWSPGATAPNQPPDQGQVKPKLGATMVGAQMSQGAMAAMAAARAQGEKSDPAKPHDDGDPILIPTSGLPAWIVGSVVLATAVLILLAGYYLLR
jgi:PPM family protein phosphatase